MTAASAYQIEVAGLRRRIEFLEAENANLREQQAPPDLIVPRQWCLTEYEETLLGVLLRAAPQAYATRQSLHGALYGDRDVSPRILDVMICHLRKKVQPRGIVIENVWGRGYRLTDAGRAILSDVVSVMNAPPVAMPMQSFHA